MNRIHGIALDQIANTTDPKEVGALEVARQRLTNRVHELVMLDERLHGVSDRLFGPRVLQGETGKEAPLPYSEVGLLEATIDGLSRVIDSIREGVIRVEKVA